MSKTMRAAFVRAPFQFEVREVPVPQVREGWALIKVEACGICGTDMHIASYTDHKLTPQSPTAWQGFGHEVAGVVVELGAGVYNVKEGDTVTSKSRPAENAPRIRTSKTCREGFYETPR